MVNRSRSAIVLLSGGLDSAVCLWWARRRWSVYSFDVNFYRRNPKEISAARRLAEVAGVRERISVDLPFLREIQDLNGMAVKDLPSVYIPSRNMLFYALAAYWAEVKGAERIIGGHTAEDERLFPDATPNYISALNGILRVKARHSPGIKIEVPLIRIKKPDVVKLAVKLKVPLQLTWSCQGEGERPCGRCLGCRRRGEAFEAAGVTDPILYDR